MVSNKPSWVGDEELFITRFGIVVLCSGLVSRNYVRLVDSIFHDIRSQSPQPQLEYVSWQYVAKVKIFFEMPCPERHKDSRSNSTKHHLYYAVTSVI